MIIDDFYNWLLTLKYPDDCDLEIKLINFDKDISNSPDKRAITIRMMNNQYIGTFVIWDDNSCFSELLEIDSKKDILCERVDFDSLNEVKLIYRKFDSYFK